MTQRNATANGKVEYSRPRLVIYGEFANLTAGGIGSTTEVVNMGNQSSMRHP
jgi:hypothetical protein